MPYYITKKHAECKSGWAVVDDGDGYYGCHTTKKSAIDQAVAISIETDEPFKGERAAIGELSVGDWVSWNEFDPEIASQIAMIEKDQALLEIFDEEDGVFSTTEKFMVLNILKLVKIQRPEMVAQEMHEPHDGLLAKAEAIVAKIESMNESEPMTETVVDNQRDKWLRAAWKIKARLEGNSEGRSLGGIETRANHVELRAEGDGRTFSGYASVFNEPSLPLPFTEIVKPGAFKRSLQSRNRMMLLWNHDTSNPLASTRNGSLVLTEDAKGLFVTATLPDTTLGRDIAELVRTGVIDAMSFGFSVRKDSWSHDGGTRYLEDVSLSEVSLVSTPAYEQTSGTVSVRSVDGISADALADALLKIESGEELAPDQGALVAEVISKLTKTSEVEEVEGDIVALYKKKLDLIEKGI